METYIGTKIIKAWPQECEEDIHNSKKGDPGYGVEYEDGYQSWSPAEVFERAYREIGNAVSDLKLGNINGPLALRRGNRLVGGAHTEYSFYLNDSDIHPLFSIKFEDETGTNGERTGATMGNILDIIRDRLLYFQSGGHGSLHNEIAISLLERVNTVLANVKAGNKPTVSWGDAVDFMKNGYLVQHADWRSKKQVVYLQAGSKVDIENLKERPKEAASRAGHSHTHIEPHFDLMDSKGNITVGWMPTMEEMLSDKWIVVELEKEQ